MFDVGILRFVDLNFWSQERESPVGSIESVGLFNWGEHDGAVMIMRRVALMRFEFCEMKMGVVVKVRKPEGLWTDRNGLTHTVLSFSNLFLRVLTATMCTGTLDT